MNTTSKLMGVVQGQATSALADALGNLIKSTYITNVTWDSSTHTLAFWGGSVLKYSCVINLGPVPLVDDPTKPLYLLSKQNGSTVTLGAVGTVGNTYQTSTDGTTWSNYTLGTSIPLDDGEGVYFRCTAFNTQFSFSAYVHFVMTGLIEAYHNINSMVSSSFDSLYDLTSLTYGRWCLNSLFEECASLTKAPLLPATTLSEGCYAAMFYFTTSGQSLLVQPPALPATTLASQCYDLMFVNCTSLTQAPSLPATTLASLCYNRMFHGCTSLTQAPTLSATTLADRCYQQMFHGCSSLTQAPALPATTLADQCYLYMFRDCTSLNEVRIAATDISASNCISGWLYNVASSGNFYCEPGVLYPSGNNGIPTNWVRHDIPAIEDDPTKPLYLLSKQDGSVVKLARSGSGTLPTYQTSTDNETWTDYTLATSITLNEGEGVYFRCKTTRTTAFSMSLYVTFRASTGAIEAYHNVNSMLSPDFTNMSSLTVGFAFLCLFGGPDNTYNYLRKAPLLPSTTLSSYCYSSMFYNCINLTQAPVLPATTLGANCYSTMFYDCTGLTRAPELPATTLANDCYGSMFNGCTSLVTPPALPSLSLADQCYEYMFKGCTSLTKAPALPATTLVGECYAYMFKDCTSLNEIRIYATTKVSTNSLYAWLNGASTTGDFYCVQGVTFPSGTSGKPSGWTRHNINDYPST